MKQKIIYGLLWIGLFSISSLLFKDVVLVNGKGLEQLVGLLTLVGSYFGFRIIQSLNKQKALQK